MEFFTTQQLNDAEWISDYFETMQFSVDIKRTTGLIYLNLIRQERQMQNRRLEWKRLRVGEKYVDAQVE